MDDGDRLLQAREGVVFRDIFIDGFVYIENAGGEGPLGFGDQDSFIPLRYGCTAAESAANGRLCSTTGLGARSKAMYQQLYGTVDNAVDPFADARDPTTGKTMLRIYGDVLYATAVAYGAGLIQGFLNEVNIRHRRSRRPVYGRGVQAGDLQRERSTDQQGQIASYAWDLTDDGTFDQSSPAPTTQYTYPCAVQRSGAAASHRQRWLRRRGRPRTCHHPRRHGAGDHERHCNTGQPLAGESPDAAGHHLRVGRRRVRRHHVPHRRCDEQRRGEGTRTLWWRAGLDRVGRPDDSASR